MSTHPNTILYLALTPDGLTRKTLRDILADSGKDIKEDGEIPYIKIGNEDYHVNIMEESYNESDQISAKEGDIVLHDLVTYGYGEKIEWCKLEEQKTALEEWAKVISKKFNCSYKIYVSANYW